MEKSKEDTRINRKEREVVADNFIKQIAEIYGVKSYQHLTEIWVGDNDENPMPGKTVIRVTISF